jgi:hypothetical protein
VSDNVNRGSLASCSSLSELTLPIYCDHTTQVIGNFLKDLELYFDLKGVSENLKLPIFERKVYRGILGSVYDKEKENWRILTKKFMQ